MWGSNTSKTSLAHFLRALNDPRFYLGDSNFTINDLNAYVAGVTLAHNDIMKELLSKYCTFSSQRDWVSWYGSQPAIFEKRSEGGRPAVQRQSFGLQVCGAPLSADWTAFSINEEGLRLMSGQEFKVQVDAIMDGDKLRLIREVLYRLLTPTEEAFTDHRSDGRAVAVKGLANGDAWVYPVGIYGNAVSTNHNHYLFQAGAVLSDIDLDAGLSTVREHGIRTSKIICSPADAALFTTANIPGFLPALYMGIDKADNVDRIDDSSVRRLTQEDLSSLDEIPVGIYKGVKIYSLWWWPQGYLDFGPAMDAPEYKPLVCRTFTGGYNLGSMQAEIGNVTVGGVKKSGFGDLRPIMQKSGTFTSLYDIDMFEREVGFGTKNRVSHAIMSLTPAAYVIPNVDNLIVSL